MLIAPVGEPEEAEPEKAVPEEAEPETAVPEEAELEEAVRSAKSLPRRVYPRASAVRSARRLLCLLCRLSHTHGYLYRAPHWRWPHFSSLSCVCV